MNQWKVAAKPEIRVWVTSRINRRVPSLLAAGQMIRRYWQDQSSEIFYQDPRAGLIEVDGRVAAHVSYNGRIWEGADRFTSGKRELMVWPEQEAWSVVTLGSDSRARAVQVFDRKEMAEAKARDIGDCYVLKGTQQRNRPLGQVEEHDQDVEAKYFQ